MGYQMSRAVLRSHKCGKVVSESFLTTFWLVSWCWILLEDAALPLKQSIIEWLPCRLEDGFFIDFSSRFYSSLAEMNRSSPFLQHSPSHHHRRWMETSLNSGNFCIGFVQCRSIHLIILLIKFCSMVNNFLSL